MNQKLRNTFFKAAERLFNLPSGNYSCHSINRIVGVSISDSSHERTLYENLFNCEWVTFGSHFEKCFPVEASKMAPTEIDDELKEVRVLALLLAGHILSDDLHTKRLDDEEREEKKKVFVTAAQMIDSGGSSSFSCVCLKLASRSINNHDEQNPVERTFYENLFDCRYNIFEKLYETSFPKEYNDLVNGNYKQFDNEMKQIRTLALLLAAEVYTDQQ